MVHFQMKTRLQTTGELEEVVPSNSLPEDVPIFVYSEFLLFL